MAERIQTMITVGTGVQAAAQGANALANTAAQVNQVAKQAVSGAALVSSSTQVHGKIHQLFQSTDPSAERIRAALGKAVEEIEAALGKVVDVAVGELVERYFIVNKRNIAMRGLPPTRAWSYQDVVKNIVEERLPITQGRSKEEVALFRQSLQRHVTDRLIQEYPDLATVAGMQGMNYAKGEVDRIFKAVYRTMDAYTKLLNLSASI